MEGSIRPTALEIYIPRRIDEVMLKGTVAEKWRERRNGEESEHR